MRRAPDTEFSAEQRREIEAWIEANISEVPDSVRAFLTLHRTYLSVEGDPRRALESAWRELRRALHLTPSSEKRRPSGSPLAGVPRQEPQAAHQSEREKLEAEQARGLELADWHKMLEDRHHRRSARIKEKLAKMPTEKKTDDAAALDDIPRVEDIELTPEEIAANRAFAVRVANSLGLGDGADPALKSVNEALMPTGAVLSTEKHVTLPAEVPADLADAQVIKRLSEERVRYDFSVAVTRIALDVEKKVLVDSDGERHVIAASTSEYGPPRFAVTWRALATLAVLVGQFAMPFHRLGTLLSTPGKRFTAGALSRMLHYVARRLVPIYLELVAELANAEIIAGDDTSCRVLEVSTHLKEACTQSEAERKKPPWANYQTPSAAEESYRRCGAAERARIRRRDEGDRTATRSREETASLGVLIGRRLSFESPRKNGDGPKEALHTTVLSGRSAAEDPRSLIVLYRSHLGSCGNLFEALLRMRDPQLRDVILQGDLSTSNVVSAPDLVSRFGIRQIACSAHARRPFAVHEEEDPDQCAYMLHLFLGLAMYEQQLDRVGRNRENVLGVRAAACKYLWVRIFELAEEMATKWSKATKLGNAARYIIKHFRPLTMYLDDHRLEPSNNLRERMLRMEKLIEGSSMFRRSLEGRFVLDVVRTILQTSVAAGVPAMDYLVSVLRSSDDDIQRSPGRFTPRAWAVNAGASASEVPPR